jgi:hypothetical protein
LYITEGSKGKCRGRKKEVSTEGGDKTSEVIGISYTFAVGKRVGYESVGMDV